MKRRSTEICSICKRRPVFIKKRGLCTDCYRSEYNAGNISRLPKRERPRKERTPSLTAQIAPEVAAMYREGLPLPDIAKHFAVHRTTITRAIRAAGVVPDRGPAGGKRKRLSAKAVALHIEGIEPIAVAKVLGVNRSTVIGWLKDAGVYNPQLGRAGGYERQRIFTTEQEEDIVRRYLAGEKQYEIATSLGVPRSTICTITQRRNGSTDRETITKRRWGEHRAAADDAPCKVCSDLGKGKRKIAGRCPTCYAYFIRYGVERPAYLIERAWKVA